MKVFSWRNAALAVVLVAVSGQASAWGGRGDWRGGGGHYHRGSSASLWIGGAALLGAGALIGMSASRPAYSSSVYVGPGYAPVYGPAYGGYYGPAVTYAAPPVYVQPPVTYVAPPVVYGTPQTEYVQPSYNTVQPSYNNTQQVARYSNADDVVAYPSKGQNVAQQSRDREACRSWAMNQSGFDPSYVTTYTTSANTESYQRALGACYKGRGYSIN